MVKIQSLLYFDCLNLIFEHFLNYMVLNFLRDIITNLLNLFLDSIILSDRIFD